MRGPFRFGIRRHGRVDFRGIHGQIGFLVEFQQSQLENWNHCGWS